MNASGRQFVSEVKARWRSGEPPDACTVLATHPHIVHDKSLVLDLAYEEFCQRTSAGEAVDIETFCGRFSHFRHSLHRRLEVHEFLDGNPAFLDEVRDGAWPEPGDTLCGFALLAELGRGAIGRVFLAEELALANRRVVVKVTHGGYAEAETLSRLKHPHIVPIHSIHEESLSGLTLICMPFLGRWTLQDLLDVTSVTGRPASMAQPLAALRARDGLSEEDFPEVAAPRHHHYIDSVLALGASLCDALAHTHAKDILHLDLKPSNVLLTPAGSPLLLDFNLSLNGALGSSLVGGTMPYMSPEQIRAMVLGRDETIDERADIYALGVILCQLLTGVYPFGQLTWRATPQEFAARLLEQQRRGVAHAFVPQPLLGDELAAIIGKALAWQPRDRYVSAEAFAAALRQQLLPRWRFARYRRAHRREFLAASLASMGVVALLATAYSLQEPFEQRELRHAWALFEAGDNEAALARFESVIAANDRNADAWFGRGRCHQRLGDFVGASDHFYRAYQLQPDPRTAACRGFCDLVIGQHARAEYRFKESIRGGFANPEVFNSLANTYEGMQRFKEAEANFRLAIEQRPDFSVAWHNLGLLVIVRGSRLAEAEHCIQQAIAGDAISPHHFLDAAMTAWKQRSMSPNWKARARHYLIEGSKIGLCAEKIEKLPLLREFKDDAELLTALHKNPSPSPFVPALTDPLGDRFISLAGTIPNAR